jgi:O-antigen/teichoic acid export membrane protein
VSRAAVVGLNLITSYGRLIASMAVMAVLTPYMVDSLGAKAFGLWSLTLSVLGFFSLFDLGFGSALVKYVAECRGSGDIARRNRIVSTLMLVYLVLTALSALAVGALHPFYIELMQIPKDSDHMALILLWMMSVRLVFLPLPLGLFRSILQGEQKFSVINLIQTVCTAGYGLLAWQTLAHGGGLVELAWVNIAVMLVEYLWYVRASYRHIPQLRVSRELVDRKLVREVGEFSTASFVVNIASLVLLRTDPILIKLFLPLSAVAIYAVCLKVAEALLMLLKQFINVLSPLIAELNGEGQREKIRFVLLACTRYSLVPGLAAGIFLVFYSSELLDLWIGPDFRQGSSTLALLIVSVLVSVPQMIASSILAMTGRHRITASAAIWSALINVGLSLALVGPLGLVGVALATLCATVLVDIFIVLRVACREYQVSVLDYGRGVLLPLVMPALAQSAVLMLGRQLRFQGLIPLLLWGAFTAAVFGAVFLLTGLERLEKEALRQRLARR